MQKWFRATTRIPLMEKGSGGEEPRDSVVFLARGALIIPGEDFRLGEIEWGVSTGGKRMTMVRIYSEGHPILKSEALYVWEEVTDPSSHHYGMEPIPDPNLSV